MDNKPWMTYTVKGILAGIRADLAFDRLPILADALEEAGFGEVDPAALAAMRSDDHPFLYSDGLRRVVEGDLTMTQLVAERWLADLASNIHDYDYDFPEDEHGERLPKPDGVGLEDWYDQHRVAQDGQTLDWLLDVLDNYCEFGDYECLWFDTPEFLYETAEEMWKNYKTLTGRTPVVADRDEEEVVDENPPVPFRCAC